MKLSKLIPLLCEDALVMDLDSNVTYNIDKDVSKGDEMFRVLEKKIISVSSFYDQVLVKVKLQ